MWNNDSALASEDIPHRLSLQFEFTRVLYYRIIVYYQSSNLSQTRLPYIIPVSSDSTGFCNTDSLFVNDWLIVHKRARCQRASSNILLDTGSVVTQSSINPPWFSVTRTYDGDVSTWGGTYTVNRPWWQVCRHPDLQTTTRDGGSIYSVYSCIQQTASCGKLRPCNTLKSCFFLVMFVCGYLCGSLFIRVFASVCVSVSLCDAVFFVGVCVSVYASAVCRHSVGTGRCGYDRETRYMDDRFLLPAVLNEIHSSFTLRV